MLGAAGQDVVAAIDGEEVIRFLRGLVACRTENPPGGERPAAEYIVARLRPLGFDVELFEPLPNRTNVIATLPGAGSGPTLIFNGHIDTKPAQPAPGSTEAWRFDPWQGGVEGNLVYGNGAADMKGGVASAIMAAEAVVRSGRRLRGTIQIQAVGDEEQGSAYGAKAVAARGIAADWAIVPEPTELDLSVAQLGALWLAVETIGERGHASHPYRHVNAIEQMLQVIDAAKKVTEDRRARLPHHTLFPHHPTLNLGSIEGGLHPGVVADRCRLTMDFRLMPGETLKGVLAAMKAEVARRQEMDPKLQVEYGFVGSGGAEPNEIGADSPVVLALARASEQVLGREPQRIGFTGFSDAAVLGGAGIPSVVFGPGSLKRAHTVNEYVEADQVIDCARIFALTILDLLG